MSINYTTLFTELGRCVFWSNTLLTEQNTLFLAPTTGEADNLLTQYEGDRQFVPNFQVQVQSQATTMAAWVGQAVQIANNTLAGLQSALNAPNTNPATILPLLSAQMVVDSQTIEHSVITAPAITPGGSNVGNGVLLATTLNGMGVVDQRIGPETITFACISSQWSGGTAGAEVFTINGQPNTPGPNVYGNIGHGSGDQFSVADSRNKISNGNFETWTVTNTPTGWVTVGTIGTNIKETTAVVHSGTAALELLGDGTTTTITLSQVVAPAIRANTLYAGSVWVRKGGTVTGGSTLAITVNGTGATTQTLLSLDPSTLTTSYIQYHLFFATASTVPPSNYQVEINWTAANTAGASALIYVDDFVLALPTTFGYASYAIFRGSADFAVADSFAVVTAVTTPGVFQSFFVRWYNQFLNSSGSPTIADSLAT